MLLHIIALTVPFTRKCKWWKRSFSTEFGSRLRQVMQFGFMKGKRTTDAIFTVRQIQENFRVKGKKLYFGFVDLESF